MTVGELIEKLRQLDPELELYLYADPEGLSTMKPESVFGMKDDYSSHRVAVISAWEHKLGDWIPI